MLQKIVLPKNSITFSNITFSGWKNPPNTCDINVGETSKPTLLSYACANFYTFFVGVACTFHWHKSVVC